MTKEQRDFVFEVEKEIRQEKEGTNFRVYASISIVRIQYLLEDKHFRMMVIKDNDTKSEIRRIMLKLFKELLKDIEAEKKKESQ